MKLANIRIVVIVLCLFMACKVNANNDESENYEFYANQIVNLLAKRMEEEFDLRCVGEGGSMPHDVRTMAVEFIAYRRANVEQARELMVKVTERFIEAINGNSKIRPFLREYPIQPFQAKVSISFTKKNNYPYGDGSISHAFQVKNKIYYDSENSLKRLVTVFEEPYEEALRIVQSNKSE